MIDRTYSTQTHALAGKKSDLLGSIDVVMDLRKKEYGKE
jgi:hypothetical protein